jgi:hypothetical protein
MFGQTVDMIEYYLGAWVCYCPGHDHGDGDIGSSESELGYGIKGHPLPVVRRNAIHIKLFPPQSLDEHYYGFNTWHRRAGRYPSCIARTFILLLGHTNSFIAK